MKKLILALAAATTVLVSCGGDGDGDDGDKYSSAYSYAISLQKEYVPTVIKRAFGSGNFINIRMKNLDEYARPDLDRIKEIINNDIPYICQNNDDFYYSSSWIIEIKTLDLKLNLGSYKIDCEFYNLQEL